MKLTSLKYYLLFKIQRLLECRIQMLIKILPTILVEWQELSLVKLECLICLIFVSITILQAASSLKHADFVMTLLNIPI